MRGLTEEAKGGACTIGFLLHQIAVGRNALTAAESILTGVSLMRGKMPTETVVSGRGLDRLPATTQVCQTA